MLPTCPKEKFFIFEVKCMQILLGYGFILTLLDKYFQAYSMPICCIDPSFVVVYFSKVFMNYILEYLFYFIVLVFFFKNSYYKYFNLHCYLLCLSFLCNLLKYVLYLQFCYFLTSVFTVFPIISNLSLCSFQSHLDLYYKGFFLLHLFWVLQAHNSYPFNILPYLPSLEFLHFCFMIFLHRGVFFFLTCAFSFCCFPLYFPYCTFLFMLCQLLLVTYYFIAQQFIKGCWGRRQRAMPSKSQNPKAVSALPAFLLKWLFDIASPSSLNQTYLAELLQPAQLATPYSPSPISALIGIWFRMNPSPYKVGLCMFWDLSPLSHLAIICTSFLYLLLGSFCPPQIL